METKVPNRACICLLEGLGEPLVDECFDVAKPHRGTPAKDWQVPEPIKQLPFLPSIQSAYEQGYRRMVFSGNYTNADSLLQFGNDVLLIGGDYGSEVDDIFVRTAVRSYRKESSLLSLVIAILGVKHIPGKHGEAIASDLYVMKEGASVGESAGFKEIEEFIQENRVLRWQDELTRLLESGTVTVVSIKKARAHNDGLGDFLKQQEKKGTPSGSRG